MPPTPPRVWPLQGATNFRDLGGYAGHGSRGAAPSAAGELDCSLCYCCAGSRSSLDLADAIEFLGANLSTASSFDASPGP